MMQDEHYIAKMAGVRVLVVLMLAVGYASTMSTGPDTLEVLSIYYVQPSWISIQILFFLSGYLAYASLVRHQNAADYFASKVKRILPTLSFYTLIVVLVIYPLVGIRSESVWEDVVKLATYFLETVSCLDPGQPLPGLLDDALYMCLIQGAIWTLKWGLVAHIGAICLYWLGFLRVRAVLPLLAFMALVGYSVSHYLYEVTPDASFDNIVLACRLSFPFLLGMSVYAYRSYVPEFGWKSIGICLALLGLGICHYEFLRWTPLIEVLISAAFMFLAMVVALSQRSYLSWLNHWPNLTLILYLVNWPVAQLIVMYYPNISQVTLIVSATSLSLLMSVTSYVVFRKLGQKLRSKLHNNVSVPRISV